MMIYNGADLLSIIETDMNILMKSSLKITTLLQDII